MLEALPGMRVVALALGENCPDHARMLIGHRNERFVVADPLCEFDHPPLKPGTLFQRPRLGGPQAGARTLSQ